MTQDDDQFPVGMRVLVVDDDRTCLWTWRLCFLTATIMVCLCYACDGLDFLIIKAF